MIKDMSFRLILWVSERLQVGGRDFMNGALRVYGLFGGLPYPSPTSNPSGFHQGLFGARDERTESQRRKIMESRLRDGYRILERGR